MKIVFNKDWDKQTIKKIVNENYYLNFSNYEDLKALCICPFADEDYETDYQEMIYVVPLKWLKAVVKEEFKVKNLNLWLQNTYTTDESEIIFERALNERQIIMVDFK
jgi:hypothetical protein